MGYFSNGTEGDLYEAEYCANCANYRVLEEAACMTCPVLEVHALFNYDQCKDGQLGDALTLLLGTLIPHDVHNEQCAMFLERPPTGGDEG